MPCTHTNPPQEELRLKADEPRFCPHGYISQRLKRGRFALQSEKPLNPKALKPFKKFKWLYWFDCEGTLPPAASSVYLLNCKKSSSETTDRQTEAAAPSAEHINNYHGRFHLCDAGKKKTSQMWRRNGVSVCTLVHHSTEKNHSDIHGDKLWQHSCDVFYTAQTDSLL